MSTRFTLPFVWWPNAVGVPLPGAKLYFYRTNTSTPLDTFTNASLTIANANPVVADGTGIFPAIFLGPDRYKVVLKTSAEVTIWTADPVDSSGILGQTVTTVAALKALTPTSAFPANASVRVLGYYAASDGGGGDFYWDSASTATDDGGTVLQPDSLPTAGRWRRVIQGADLLVDWFGTRGDGVTADQNAIQAAYTAMTTTGLGSLHYGRAKTYLLTSGTLLPPSGARIHGNGATLKCRHTGGGDRVHIVREATDVVVEDLRLLDDTRESWPLVTVVGTFQVGEGVTNTGSIAVHGSPGVATGIIEAINGTQLTVRRTSVIGRFGPSNVVNGVTSGATARIAEFLQVINVSGSFQAGETFTISSGPSGVLVSLVGATATLSRTTASAFAYGDVLTGGTSGATLTITTFSTAAEAPTVYVRPALTMFAVQNSSRVTHAYCRAEGARFYGFAVTQNSDTGAFGACDDTRWLYCQAIDCGQFGFEGFPKVKSKRIEVTGCLAYRCGHDAATSGAGYKMGSLTEGANIHHNVAMECNFGFANGLWEGASINNNIVIDSYQYSITAGFNDHSLDIPASFSSLVIADNLIAHTAAFVPEQSVYAGISLYAWVRGRGDLTVKRNTFIGLHYRLGEVFTEVPVDRISMTGNVWRRCNGIFNMESVRPPDWAAGRLYRTNRRAVNAGNLYLMVTPTPIGGSLSISGGTPPTHTSGIVSDGLLDWEYIAHVGGTTTSLGVTNSTIPQFPHGMIFTDNLLDWNGTESSTNNAVLRGTQMQVLRNTLIRPGANAFNILGHKLSASGNRIKSGNVSAETVGSAFFIPVYLGNSFAWEYSFIDNYVTNGLLAAWAASTVVPLGEFRLTANDRLYVYTVAGTTDVTAPTGTGGEITDGTAKALFYGQMPDPIPAWVAATAVLARTFLRHDGRRYRVAVGGTTDATTGPSHTTGSAANGTATLEYIKADDIGAITGLIGSSTTLPIVRLLGNVFDDAAIKVLNTSPAAATVATGLYWNLGRRRIFESPSAPAAGAHVVGDIAFTTVPAAGGVLLNINTTSGTPGTFKTVSINA